MLAYGDLSYGGLSTMKRQLIVLIVLMISFSPMVLPVTSGERRRSLDLTSDALAQGETQNERRIEQGLFAEGIISTDEPEYAPTFTADGKIVYFTRLSRERRFPAIYISRLTNGKWDKPEVAPFSGEYPDEYPMLSPDGSKLYFASRRPTEGDGLKKYNDIWLVKTTPKGWGAPVHLGAPVNTDFVDSHPSVTKDGAIYFHSNRDGNMDVYRSKLIGGKYAKPERLPFNSDAIDGEAFVSHDESFVIFSSARKDGYGSGDLYITCFRSGKWTEPRNLGPGVNKPGWDGNPFLSRDKKYLYVSLGSDTSWIDIKRVELSNPISCN